MTRKQRIRVCGNLMQLMSCAKSIQAKQVYRRQLETQLARLREKKAVAKDDCVKKSNFTAILPQDNGK